MADSQTTCWTLIQGAAAGCEIDRTMFAERYTPVVRAYLAARWRGTPLIQDLDDAIQTVFVECYREGGVLQTVEPGRPGGFRAFFYGVLRNVAWRVERHRARSREVQPGSVFDAGPSDDAGLSRVFDRAWALAVVREAGAVQATRAETLGAEAVRRVTLLRLRFEEGLPIRDIAARWELPADFLHREYARARREFRDALMEVVRNHHHGSAADTESECARLLGLLE